jgi:hypothetical protein
LESVVIPNEINQAAVGIARDLKHKLLNLKNQENALAIAKFVLALEQEVNASVSHKTNVTRALIKL